MDKYKVKINSKEYWNERFDKDWEVANGIGQTRYFAELACALFPSWFVKDVCRNSYEVCDLGCAEGDAVPILQKAFPMSAIHGEDFSEKAVEIAKDRYPSYNFKISNILKPEGEIKYPVIYSSNTIEHFSNTYNVLKNMEERSSNYTVILMPFREDFEVSEHEVILDTSDVPLVVGDSQLVFSKSVYCNSEFYGREQMLLIYSKDQNIKKASLLHDCVEFVCNSEHKKLKTSNEELKKDWKNLNDNLYLAREQLKVLDYNYKKLENEKNNIENEKNNIENEKNKIINNINELDEKILNLKSEIIQLKDDKKVLEEKENYEQEEKYKNLKEILFDVNSLLNDVSEEKSYKKLLYLRRIKDQLIRGSKVEKKDFIKYTLNKILKREKYLCRNLKSFNKVDIAKEKLQYLMQNNYIYKNNYIKNELYSEIIKNTSQVYIFSGIPYYDIGGGQRCSQLARNFDKMGYEVHYFYAFDSSESVKFDLMLPTYTHKHIDNTSLNEVFGSIKDNAIFIFEAPYVKFIPYLRKAEQLKIKTVYEHIDNWETSLGSLLYDRESFEDFIKYSDILVATSIELKKQLNTYTNKPVEYLPNAVDITIFEPKYSYIRPNDLVIGKQKTLVYFGSLWGEWFDWDLIKNTALSCPKSSFNIIGDYSGISHIIEEMPDNVYFLGLKKQYELPAYLKYSDFAMLPFKNCEIGKYVSPLKIFEYIAMEKKVLATPLPDILGYPNTLCSEDYKEWVDEINSDIELESVDNFTVDNSWYSRCNELLNVTQNDYLEENIIESRKISIIILNYNNKDVIVKCVNSLLRHMNRYMYQIVVVDNNSNDGSYELLNSVYSDKITLVKNSKNGCSSGRNLGVKNANGDILVFIDSDQWAVSDRWLDIGLYILNKYKGIGAISCGAGWFDQSALTGPIVDYLPNKGIKPWQLFRDDVSYLATSGLVMEKRVFNLLDGFDEYYDPTCFEDTDLSFQVENLGLKIVFTPYINLMHLPHQTTQSGSKGHSELMERNGRYFKEKWMRLNEKLLKKAWENRKNIEL
ncbi:glycosyltransferase [Clostridium beijerinckii]|uniref:glycosyltransferase n=1 Tax=Clostridium beijerinckii TaxID=1520 RepID=UPI0015715C53|nr:glycosyltransferase [Clostridium beijerinckii]NRT74181.1 GT2 family glycosyltransferase [Clostridium beijerinckii]